MADWHVVQQRAGIVKLANGDYIDGVIITIAAGPDGVELTMGIRNELYANKDLVQTRLQSIYDQWLAIQNLNG